MKIRTSVFAGLLFFSCLGAVSSALAKDDGIVSKQEFAPASYCHEQVPAIRPITLDTDHPTLKSADTGDIIDYYGPCDENPLSQDQIREQRMDAQVRGRWSQDYAD